MQNLKIFIRGIFVKIYNYLQQLIQNQKLMDFSDRLAKMFPDTKVTILNPNLLNNGSKSQKFESNKPTKSNNFKQNENKLPYNFQQAKTDHDVFYQLMKSGNFFSTEEGQFSYLGLTPPKYDYQQYKQQNVITDKAINKKLDQAIVQIKEMFSIGAPVFNSKLLNNLIMEDSKMKNKIQSLFEKGFAKAGIILLVGFKHGMLDSIKIKSIQKSLEKQINPLFYSFAALHFMKDNLKKSKQLLQIATKYKQPFAFQFLGQMYQRQDNYQKAFEMFKVAQKLGFKYSAWLHLADLYIQGSQTFPCNTFRAYQYQTRVAELISYPQQRIPSQKVYFSYSSKSLPKREQQKNLIQGHVISAYLKGDLMQLRQYSKKLEEPFHRPIVQQFRQNLRAASGDRQITVKNFQIVQGIDIKTGMFVGKCLARESMQIIIIDIWDQILNKTELQQTFIEGKKLRVHFFASAEFNGLIVHTQPKYFQIVKDPYIAKYQITTESMRNYAKLLLTSSYQLESVIIYDHLVEKGRQQLSILQGNKGLAYDRKGKYQEAEQCYKQSLQFSYYQKSVLRLAYLYIKTNRINKALQTAKLVKDDKQRTILEKKINEEKNKTK